jgi:hypothetical protein
MSLLTNCPRAPHALPHFNHRDTTVSLYIAICTCHSEATRARLTRLTRFHISLLGNHNDTAVSLSTVIRARARASRASGIGTRIQADQGIRDARASRASGKCRQAPRWNACTVTRPIRMSRTQHWLSSWAPLRMLLGSRYFLYALWDSVNKIM